ncbi:cation transporter [Ilyomonas limi]|uniref:Cation transporter n=1 Tax=Ilyomonas limi TaxID=2575867 RepID=A0A4U3KVE9_9BACT|nr:cation transporter [Ilyomonas limi]TKK66322.1 cation transporter [Ilyomonas limi]
MKTLKALIVALAALLVFQTVNAQSDKSQRTIGIKTQILNVNGTCGMCKKRIESAAWSVAGVKSAIWDEDTKKLIVKYDLFKKQAFENVANKIALVGHDNQIVKASDTSYNALPDCCHYRHS